MRSQSLARAAASALVLGGMLVLVACAREPADDAPHDMPMGDMPMPGMPMNGAPGNGMADMMRRHAAEAGSTATQLRAHLTTMRALSADAQHARMGVHAAHVARMLTMMERHMREMSMGMPMDAEHMGALLGMSAEQYRAMLQEMRELRDELETLQTAPVAALRARMAAHLDRLERFVGMMEQSAAHMRHAEPH